MTLSHLVGDATVHLQLEVDDPGEALAESRLIDASSWTPEGEIRDITLVDIDGNPTNDPGPTPEPLTVDIWLFNGGPRPLAQQLTWNDADLVGLALTHYYEGEEDSMAQGDAYYYVTPHGYTASQFTIFDTNETVAQRLGDWGRANKITGAPKEGPWRAESR